MKNTYYFPHDFNAREDEKIMFLLSKHKWEGYGIYWLLVELLHEATSNKLNLKLLDGISFKHNIDITVLKAVISTAKEADLFYEENGFILSKRVLQNVNDLNVFREKKSLAGKAGMAKRWGNYNTVITKHNTVITKHNKGKESKRKESKVKERKELEVASEPSSHIQEILNIFYKINPTLNFGNKTQRKSIEEMIIRFGIEKTTKMAEYAISIYSEPFAPTITTPYQLKEKVAQLISYWQRNQTIKYDNKIEFVGINKK